MSRLRISTSLATLPTLFSFIIVLAVHFLLCIHFQIILTNHLEKSCEISTELHWINTLVWVDGEDMMYITYTVFQRPCARARVKTVQGASWPGPGLLNLLVSTCHLALRSHARHLFSMSKCSTCLCFPDPCRFPSFCLENSWLSSH